MVVFEGQTGSVGGHGGMCLWANDTGAAFRFDEFGDVTFNQSGYGENAKVTVQLGKEYGRYFCSTAVCGGFKNWISSLGTVTAVVTAGRVTVILSDCITKNPMAGVKVCLGKMCQNTNANGEAYLGQFLFGTYGLVAAATGYENLVEDFTVNAAEHRISRCLTPTGAPVPGKGCDQWPGFLRPFCAWLTGLLDTIRARLDTFYDAEIAPKLAWVAARLAAAETNIEEIVQRAEEEAASWRASLEGVKAEVRSWLSESLAGLKKDIETTLIDPIREKLKGIGQALGDLWQAAEEIVAAAEVEAAAWRKGVLDLEGSLKAWIQAEILELFWKALTAENKKEA